MLCDVVRDSLLSLAVILPMMDVKRREVEEVCYLFCDVVHGFLSRLAFILLRREGKERDGSVRRFVPNFVV